MLRDGEQMRVREVAKALSIAEAAVKSRACTAPAKPLKSPERVGLLKRAHLHPSARLPALVI
jgi:hypothetical protein